MVQRSIVGLFLVVALYGQSGPRPPCGSPPLPDYPALGSAPVVQVWQQFDWTPAACTDWQPMASALLVATAGRFAVPGGSTELLGRIGAVSKTKGLLYWSTTHQQWRPMILDAYALTGEAGARRKDFDPREFGKDRRYTFQEDNLLGKMRYWNRVSASEDRIVIETRSLDEVKTLGIVLVQPGEIASVCFLNREPANVWSYYNLTRMPKAASVLTMGHDASLINRAVAMYRYLAGIRADQEPPAAR